MSKKLITKVRNSIPNIMTISAMCLGLTALNLSYVRADVYISLLLLLAAAILDGLDGKVARKLGISSPVGAQLDSLADFLNFCIAPALILYEWVFKDFYFFGWLVTLIYLTAGAWRLARFNVMYTEGAENVKSNYFVGMPSPAGAIMVFAPIILTLEDHMNSSHIVYKALYVALIAFMMSSKVRTPSLKEFSLQKKHKKYALLLFILFCAAAFINPVTVYLYAICTYSFSIVFVNARWYILKNRGAKERS